MMLIFMKGNASIPIRFYDAAMADEKDFERRKLLADQGFTAHRTALGKEVKRWQEGGSPDRFCVGDVSEFFSRQ
jgi:hypothetical protein